MTDTTPETTTGTTPDHSVKARLRAAMTAAMKVREELALGALRQAASWVKGVKCAKAVSVSKIKTARSRPKQAPKKRSTGFKPTAAVSCLQTQAASAESSSTATNSSTKAKA